MKITINSHSSIRVESDLILRFDPFQLKDAPHDADIIMITHDHYDHFSPEDIARAVKPDTVFLVPYSLAGKTGGREVVLRAGECVQVHGVSVEAVSAYNVDKPFHPRENQWLGYVVTIGGKRIYVCGDTDATPEAKNVSCDILCVPIGGTYTMDSAAAAELTLALRPELAVPTHYGSVVGSRRDLAEYIHIIGKKITVAEKVEDAQ